MGRRKINFRRIKVHASYTVEEAARATGAHKNTVRQWIKDGLSVVDDKRPLLILGSVLKQFLKNRRASRRRPCGSTQCYCFRCREPRTPDGNIADYSPITSSSGNLIAICPVCEGLMYRRVGRDGLVRLSGVLEITVRQAAATLEGTSYPSEDCDLAARGETA